MTKSYTKARGYVTDGTQVLKRSMDGLCLTEASIKLLGKYKCWPVTIKSAEVDVVTRDVTIVTVRMTKHKIYNVLADVVTGSLYCMKSGRCYTSDTRNIVDGLPA